MSFFRSLDLLGGIDGRTEFLIGDYSALCRVYACCQGRAIHFSCAKIDRVVIPEGHSLARQSDQGRGGFFSHKVRAHAVPDDDHDMGGLPEGEEAWPAAGPCWRAAGGWVGAG